MRAKLAAAVLALVMAVVGSPAQVERAHADAVAGTLALRAEIFATYPAVDCPSGYPPRVFECFQRSGNVIVPGLGSVEESYDYVIQNSPPGCTAPPGSDSLRLPATTVRLTVPGKGEIRVSTGGTGCLSRSGTPGSVSSSEPFTITGGSGPFAGASGGGTLTSLSTGSSGVDTWTGTLVVPGLQFDLAAPTIGGAIDKKVRVARRATRVRVTYAVAAKDDVDGPVPVTCSPRSGTQFAVGRTRVKCSATDKSGNSSTATFTVTVTRKR